MINKVTLIGNLGKDPEIRHFEGGGMVTRFSMATNERYVDRNDEWQTRTEWHDVVCWGKLAERVERTLKKGNLVYVEGKLTHRKWQDREGNDRYSTEVVCNVVRSLERRESGSIGGIDSGFPSIEDRFEPAGARTSDMSSSSAETPAIDDDLPF